jgi:hypothetical protein
VGQSPTGIDNISNSLRTYTISGLTYGKTYQVRVIEVIQINLPPSPFTPPFLDTFTPSSTRSVVVKDKMPPLIIPQNQTFQLAPNGYATLRQETLNNIVWGNCSSMDVKADKVTSSCSDVGNNVVTITTKDESGNESGATIIVTVVDTTPPIAYLKEATVYLDGNGFGTLTMDDVDNGSTDNCRIAQMELSRTGFSCNDLDEPEVTVFLLDKSGNSTYARAKVTVKDTLKPIVYIKSTDLFLGADGRTLLSIPLINSMITDNCGIAELEFSKGEFFQSDIGDNRVTVSHGCGG